MNEIDINNRSKTDWDAFEAMTDEEIDYSDIPPLSDDFFERAELRKPQQPQVVVTMQVDPAIFAWFNAQDGGWERKMRAALRIYVDAHTEDHPLSIG